MNGDGNGVTRRRLLAASGTVAAIATTSLLSSGSTVDPTGDGDPPERGWSFQIGEKPTKPSVVDGTAYVGNAAGSVYAIELASGEAAWTRGTGSQVARFGLVATQDAVVAGGRGGELTSFDPSSGEQLWTRTLAGACEGLRVVDGVAFVVTAEPSIVAVDALSGRIAWRYALPDEHNNRGRPTVHDGVVYYGERGHLLAVDADSGTELWRRDDWGHQAFQATASRFGANDDGVYAASWTDGTVLRMNPDDGTTVWKSNIDDYADSGPVVSENGEGLVYAAGESQVFALSQASGQVQWGIGVRPSSDADAWTYQDGTLYVAGQNQSEDLVLSSVDAATGLTNWTIDKADDDLYEWGVPTVHQDTVVVPARNGGETSLLAYGGVATGDTEPTTTTTAQTTTESTTESRTTTEDGAAETTTDDGAAETTTDGGGGDATTTRAPGNTVDGTTTSGTATTTTEESGDDEADGPTPGFGVGSALAALAAGAGVLERRRNADED